jgi:hypothetical protein
MRLCFEIDRDPSFTRIEANNEKIKNEKIPLFIPRATARRGHRGISPMVYMMRLHPDGNYMEYYGPHPRSQPSRPAARPRSAGEMLKLRRRQRETERETKRERASCCWAAWGRPVRPGLGRRFGSIPNLRSIEKLAPTD